MTTIKGTVQGGQLVFPAEATAELGLKEGDTVEVPGELLRPAPVSPFLAWVGRSPPFEGGQDSVTYHRRQRDGAEE